MSENTPRDPENDPNEVEPTESVRNPAERRSETPADDEKGEPRGQTGISRTEAKLAEDSTTGAVESKLADEASPSPVERNSSELAPCEAAVGAAKMEPSEQEPGMVVGLFESADALMAAIPRLRAKKLGNLEAYTPYPIHGIDDALGLRRSPLGAMVMVMGILGALTALGIQFWISAIDYPIVTGGKPPWSWEAFIPIMFEVTVLFATFTAGLGMLLLLNKLPFFGHLVLGTKSIQGITRDRFALAVEPELSGGNALRADAACLALQELGAVSIEVVPKATPEPVFTSQFILRALTGIVTACAVAGFIMYWLVKLFPVLPPMSYMLDQPRLGPQQASHFWKDGRGMRVPVKGTIARGYLPLAAMTQEDAAKMSNPLPRTAETLAQGKQKFGERCSVCHGALADGNGSLTAAYGAKPANLQAQQFRDYTDGQIYWVIVNGKNAMPSHAADLSSEQRWAVVHYVRALQRAQNAKDEDLMPPNGRMP